MHQAGGCMELSTADGVVQTMVYINYYIGVILFLPTAIFACGAYMHASVYYIV